MTEYEAIAIVLGSIQSLLVRLVAGKKNKSFKYIAIVSLSLFSGTMLYYIESGGITVGIKWPIAILKVMAYSFGAWATAWKQFFPYKKNPLEETANDPAIQQNVAEQQDTGVPSPNLYDISMDYEGRTHQNSIPGETLKEAVYIFMEQLPISD